MPNKTFKGWSSNKYLSEKAPESPSSALQTTYFFSETALLQKSHFIPVGNPAPPRPVRFESNKDLIISFLSVFKNFVNRSLTWLIDDNLSSIKKLVVAKLFEKNLS